ncbi:MAG TPA: trypsin-like peptidase domain-containing protein, partial [Candidatus Dormibacteraeota bacterium]
MGIAEELEAAAARVSEQALGAVVGVGGRWPSGSGFVLAQGSVVTSAHNVHGPGAQVHFGDGSRRDSTAVNADLAGDLAVVQVDTTGFTPVRFAAAAPQLGTPLFAAANPGG